MIRSTLAILVLAFLGMAAAWTGNGYYDRYSVAPMRADQDGYGFGSLFEANRRQFQNSRMNTNGEYVRGYRDDGMGYYPRYDNYGYGRGGYNDYDYGYGGSGRYLTRYRPNRGGYYNNGYGYDYGYNGGYDRHWDNRDYTGGSYNYGYGNRYNRYNRYNNDYWSYSQTPRTYSQGGYGPNYDSYRYY